MDTQALEKRLKDLEERVRKLEIKSGGQDELYSVAKDLVAKHKKASVSFLQRQLMIDFQRAEKILAALSAEGVIPVE